MFNQNNYFLSVLHSPVCLCVKVLSVCIRIRDKQCCISSNYENFPQTCKHAFRLKRLQLPKWNFALGTNMALVIWFPPSPLQKSYWQRARGKEPEKQEELRDPQAMAAVKYKEHQQLQGPGENCKLIWSDMVILMSDMIFLSPGKEL